MKLIRFEDFTQTGCNTFEKCLINNSLRSDTSLQSSLSNPLSYQTSPVKYLVTLFTLKLVSFLHDYFFCLFKIHIAQLQSRNEGGQIRIIFQLYEVDYQQLTKSIMALWKYGISFKNAFEDMVVKCHLTRILSIWGLIAFQLDQT